MMRQALEKGFSSSQRDFNCWIDFNLRFMMMTDRMKSRKHTSKRERTLRTQAQFLWMKMRIALPQFLGMFLVYFPKEETPVLDDCPYGIQESESEYGYYGAFFLIFLFFMSSPSTSNPAGDEVFLLEGRGRGQSSLTAVSCWSTVSSPGCVLMWMSQLLIWSCRVSVWERAWNWLQQLLKEQRQACSGSERGSWGRPWWVERGAVAQRGVGGRGAQQNCIIILQIIIPPPAQRALNLPKTQNHQLITKNRQFWPRGSRQWALRLFLGKVFCVDSLEKSSVSLKQEVI